MRRLGLLAAVLCLGCASQARRARRPSAAPGPPAETDEYTRYELLAPETAQFHILYEVTAIAPGATVFFNPIRRGSEASGERVIDRMTGEDAAVRGRLGRGGAQDRASPTPSPASEYIRIHLPRPVPPDGGQVRLLIEKTYKDPKSYFREGDAIVFSRSLGIRRNGIVLPGGLRADRLQRSVAGPVGAGRPHLVSFMNAGPDEAPLTITGAEAPVVRRRARAGALGAPRRLRPPPRRRPPTTRLTERAHQDRDIVYFLQQPETHAFDLYHDYTESRRGHRTST